MSLILKESNGNDRAIYTPNLHSSGGKNLLNLFSHNSITADPSFVVKFVVFLYLYLNFQSWSCIAWFLSCQNMITFNPRSWWCSWWFYTTGTLSFFFFVMHIPKLRFLPTNYWNEQTNLFYQRHQPISVLKISHGNYLNKTAIQL